MSTNKTSFWDLPSKERLSLANKRLRDTKCIVWDYARNKDTNEFGTLEELPQYIDKGFIHGFVMNKSKVEHSSKWEEISVYTDCYYLDEEFENRTFFPYHLFTDYNKALEYSKKAKEYAKWCDKPALSDILNVVKKYDNSAVITKGKRGFQSVEYEAVKIGCGTTIFRVIDNGNIIMDRGQMFTCFVIPHIDLLDKVLEIFYNDNYSSEKMVNMIAEWAIAF